MAKITLRELEGMIREAVLHRLLELSEAEGGADADPVEKGEPKDDDAEAAAPASDQPEPQAADAPPPDAPQGEDPDAEQDPGREDALDLDGDAGNEGSGEVNSFVEGKSVQSITLSDDSKVLPGAKEVILSFAQTTDALRIIVTATGKISFLVKGQMHDLP